MTLIHKVSESLLNRAVGDAKGWTKARQAWEFLHHPLPHDPTDCAPLFPEDADGCALLNATITPEIWLSLPLKDHCLLAPETRDKDCFRAAFTYLDLYHPELGAQTRDFLQALALVDRPPNGASQETCLTSVSVPDLPFCSFFSRKALRHIAPHFVVHTPDISFLAENLYHESLHHRVSLNLLENDILQPDYHSRLSPKVAIPWREKALSNVHFWELDRVLHAFCVYVGLLPYRQREAARERQREKGGGRASPLGVSLLSEGEEEGGYHPPRHPQKGIWRHAFAQARVCAHFLGQALLSHRKVLTPLGYTYVSEHWSRLQAYFPEDPVAVAQVPGSGCA
jgi:hypothetical protein